MRWLVMLLGLFLSAAPALGQRRWQPASHEPVLQPGSASQTVAIGQPSCLAEPSAYSVWFTGATAERRGRVLHARSTDGITWRWTPQPVLDVGPAGSWDGWTVDTPAVVRCSRCNQPYRLYYYGQASAAGAEGSAIGLAESHDGTSFTRVRDEPVLEPGPDGAWDCRWIESPTVRHDHDRDLWLMWYSGVGPDWLARIGLATSADGVAWTKHPANPVLTPPAEGWDDAWVAVPTVVRWRSAWWMLYAGVSANDLADGAADRPQLGFAWSVDGVHWIHPSVPVAGLDQYQPWAPAWLVDHQESRLVLWFETADGIHLATAPSPLDPRRASGPNRH
jgi:predicted GH43/DUF377 family glycosyl hydrolase